MSKAPDKAPAAAPAAAPPPADNPEAPGAPDILLQIAADRAERVKRDGPAQGLTLPLERTLPLVPFAPAEAPAPPETPEIPGASQAAALGPAPSSHPGPAPDTPPPSDPILIAEIKRRSPSAGDIAPIPEPAALAERYKAAGFRRLSVLTEEARFQGSLADLIAVKTAHPNLAVLRKDFLLTPEDITVSHRAGADAVLLIAALLPAPALRTMYRSALELGLTPLVEVHSPGDVAKVRPLSPPLIGINSRCLRRFIVDPLIPLETRTHIDWPCRIIYESGITTTDDALFVRGSGFHGFLVGQAVAENPALAPALIAAWNDAPQARRRYAPWNRLYSPGRRLPLVKICGITTLTDARAAVEAGADILGFVLAESPRKVAPALIRRCAHLPVLKAGVVVLNSSDLLPAPVAELLREGSLDLIQFHGDETPETLKLWPGFKALSLKTENDARTLAAYPAPAVLIDAFSPGEHGGTGRTLNPRLIAAAAEHRRPWIAGGLNPENVRPIVQQWNPGLVDVSTGVTLNDGTKRRKDHQKIRRFIAQAKGAPPMTPAPPAPAAPSVSKNRPSPAAPPADKPGFFGPYGGRYVAEVLRRPLEHLEDEFRQALTDPTFLADLDTFAREYTGRPTPLLHARNAGAAVGGAEIYVKVEGLANTGAHKINNAAGQALLAKRMGKTRIIAETGAGQHGVATAAACARLKLECIIYMGEEDIRRQQPNVYWMELFGAEVRPVTTGSRTLKDAVNAALRDWAASWESTHYILGSALGPAPFPDMVREFQSVIGRETRRQIIERTGGDPHALVACVGGGSNAVGFFEPYLHTPANQPILLGAEAGGRGPGAGNNAVRMTAEARPGVIQGYKSRFLIDDEGQVQLTHSISAGLDYAGIGPQLAHLGETGRIRFVSVSDGETLEALRFFAEHEGLIFAMESAHGAAAALTLARELGPGKTLVVNMSGRGDKDIFISAAALDGPNWRAFLSSESRRESPN